MDYLNIRNGIRRNTRFFRRSILVLALITSFLCPFCFSQESIASPSATTKLVSDLPPGDLIFKNRDSFFFSLSPKGDLISAVRLIDGNYYIIVLDTTDIEMVANFNVGKTLPNAIKWKDSDILVDLGREIFFLTPYSDSARELLGVYEGGESKRYRNSWKLINTLENDPEHIMVSNRWGRRPVQHKVYKYNLFTGELNEELDVTSMPSNTIWYFTRGETQVAIGRDSGDFEMYIADKGELTLVDKLKRTDKPHDWELNKKDLTWFSKKVYFEGKSADDKSIYISSNLDGDKFSLYRYDLIKKEIAEEILISSQYDIGGTVNPVWLKLDAEGKLIGIGSNVGKREVKWLDNNMSELQRKFDSEIPNRNNYISSYTKDLKYVLIHSARADRDRIILYRADQNSYTIISDNTRWLNSYPIIDENLFKYESDGIEHEAYLLTPTNKTEKNPAIVIPSTFYWGRHSQKSNPWAQYFASRGYYVLLVNHRGVAGYGKDYLISGIQDSFKLGLSDIAAATKKLTEVAGIDDKKISILGRKKGALLALLTAQKYPDLYQSSIAISAPIDIPAELKDNKRYDMVNDLEFWRLAMSSSNNKKVKGVKKQISPYHNLNSLTKPTLLVYGEKTTYLPEKKRKKVEKISKKMGEHIRIMTVKDEKDQIYKVSNKVFVAREIDQFIKETGSLGEKVSK